MKALVIPGVDFSTQRVALPLSNVPPYGRNLKHVLMTSKYDVTAGVLADSIGSDFVVPALTLALKPTKQTTATFGGKEAMGFIRDANRKCLLGNISLASKEITVHITYTNSSATTITSDRTLLAFVSPLVNNAQKMLRFSSSGPNSKVRINSSISVGALVPEQSGNVTTTAFDTLVDAVNSTKVTLTFKINFTTQTVMVYVNGIQVGTAISVTNMVEWTGQLYIGVNPLRADNIADASGLIGGVVMYDEGQSDARILAVANYLNAAFAA